MQTLKDRLAAKLTENGWTQASLAAAVGVSQTTASQWRSGAKTPSVKNTRKIAEWLGVSAAWLQYGGVDTPDTTVSPEERQAYHDKCVWYHRPAPADHGRELGNAAGFAFSGGMPTLARETGQNILDERRDGEPSVLARYTLTELSGTRLDNFLDAIKFDEFRSHLEAATATQQKVATVIKSGLKSLDDEGRLILLKVEDYGANGLLGPEYDDGRFMAVVRNILDSYKGENAGGSYGLGKSVMWACSQFGLVLVNSVLSVPVQGKRNGRYIARAEMPWHRLENDASGQGFAGPAWFGEVDPDLKCTRSYWGNDALTTDTYLTRLNEQSGTSFLIVGAYDPSGDCTTIEEMHEAITRSVVDSFWPAMVERDEDEPGPLSVIVRSERNGKTLRDDMIDPSFYAEPKTQMLRAFYEDLTVDALENPGDVVQRSITLNVPKRDGEGAHGAQQHEAVLLVMEAVEDAPDLNRVGFMRGSQMIVQESLVTGLPMGARSFYAVVLAGLAAGDEASDKAAERFLRAAEPPAHDRWMATSEVSRSYARGYAKALTEFYSDVRKSIKDVVGRPTDDLSDGPDALKELLRITQPNEDAVKRPKVKAASGGLDSDGRWAVDVTVSLPSRKGSWSFTPVMMFGAASGSGVRVGWESLTSVSRCSVSGDVITSAAGARQVRFTGVTDPQTHPVAANLSKALVDVRVYKGAQTS